MDARKLMLAKIKSDKRLNELRIGVSVYTIVRVRDFIQSTAYRSPEQVREVFNLRVGQAEGLCAYFLGEEDVVGVVFGSKREPYYDKEEQMLQMPTYSIDDLGWQELEILNQIV